MDNVSVNQEDKDKQSMKKNEWLFVNPYLIAGILGASFCLAWFFSIVLAPTYLFSGNEGVYFYQTLHIIFAAVFFITYFFIWLFSNFLQEHRGILLYLSFGCGLASAVLLVGPLASQDAALFARAVCAGVGTASLGTLWIEFLCAHLKRQVRVAIASIFALSFVWHLGIVLVDIKFTSLTLITFILISCVVYFFLYKRFILMENMPSIDAKKSDSRLEITWKPSLLTVMGSVAQGFALFGLLRTNPYAPLESLLIGIASLAVALLIFGDSLRSFVIKESFIRRLFLPVLAACIFSLLFIPAEWRYVPCLLAFCFSLLPYSSAIFATCEHIVRYNLSAIRAFSWARLYSSIGLFAGLGIGRLAFASQVFGDITLPVFVVVVVMFFILVSTTLSMKSYYPGEEEPGQTIARIGKDGEILYERYAKDAESIEDEQSCFQKKCDTVAKNYDLTNRQTEVLCLLAKGRNAAYIQNQLVISHHTAKAHIYAIYKKACIHSQQDLIDLVEDCDVNEE